VRRDWHWSVGLGNKLLGEGVKCWQLGPGSGREGRHVLLGRAGTQPSVEVDRHTAQPLEQSLARIGEVHALDAAVGPLATTRDEALRLHGVEMLGRGGDFDADGLRQLALVPGLLAFTDRRISQTGSEPPAAASSSSNARLSTRVVGEMQANRGPASR
jgi:hypothetical protein